MFKIRREVMLLVVLLLLAVFRLPAGALAEAQGMQLTGTMHLLDVQGGCWVLKEEGGGRYELVGEQAALQPLRQEGLRVTVEVRADPGLVGRCMVGRMVHLIRVVRTEAPS